MSALSKCLVIIIELIVAASDTVTNDQVSNSYEYHFVAEQMNWEQAYEYCVQICNSNLVSIHSQEELLQLSTLLTYDIEQFNTTRAEAAIGNLKLWLGLQRTNIKPDGSLQSYTSYEFVDGTDFDYGTNTSGGQYPWDNGEPSTDTASQCGAINIAESEQSDAWSVINCDDNYIPFYCKFCDTLEPTSNPTTNPTTANAITSQSRTKEPTGLPTTISPTTSAPTTTSPTTSDPTTSPSSIHRATSTTESMMMGLELIWYQAMDDNPNRTLWYNTGTFELVQNDSASLCPQSEEATDACWAICGGGLFRGGSTIGYKHLTLTYSIKPWSPEMDINLYCEIAWSLKGQDWERIDNSSDEIVAKIVYLDETTWDQDTVYLKIEALGNKSVCCYIDDLALSGVPTTATPTAPSQQPTVNPTTSNHTSAAPSTSDPTTALPTTSVPTTSAPTNSPTPKYIAGAVVDDISTSAADGNGMNVNTASPAGQGSGETNESEGLTLSADDPTLIIIGVLIVIFFCICGILFGNFIRKKKDTSKMTHTHHALTNTGVELPGFEAVATNSAKADIMSDIEAVAVGLITGEDMGDNNENVDNQLDMEQNRTPRPPPRQNKNDNQNVDENEFAELEMEGGLSMDNRGDILINDASYLKRKRSAEFRQMLGDNNLGNNLLMDDIIDDMENGDKKENTNDDGGHVTGAGENNLAATEEANVTKGSVASNVSGLSVDNGNISMPGASINVHQNEIEENDDVNSDDDNEQNGLLQTKEVSGGDDDDKDDIMPPEHDAGLGNANENSLPMGAKGGDNDIDQIITPPPMPPIPVDDEDVVSAEPQTTKGQ